MSDSAILVITKNGGTIAPRKVATVANNSVIVMTGYEGTYPANTVFGEVEFWDNTWEYHEVLVCGVFELLLCEHRLDDRYVLIRDVRELDAL